MGTERFKRIILFARQHRADQEVNETLERLTEYLQTRQLKVYQHQDTYEGFSQTLPVLDVDKMDSKTDLIIVVGGDGSLLSAARIAILKNIPVIGINRGRLGFLTDISPQEMETQLGEVLAGRYLEEQRFLLSASVHDAKNTCFQSCALNDVVLSRGNETHLIEFDVDIDKQFVSNYRSDGLILATPTGSTAYSLSAGGPIMHPNLNAIVMVPMFSHSLNSRPLVVARDSVIKLHISLNNENNLQLSCDGQESVAIEPGKTVTIVQHSSELRLLHPQDYTYYDTLRIKLGWGMKPRGQ